MPDSRTIVFQGGERKSRDPKS